MRRTLFLTTQASLMLRKVDRAFIRGVWVMLDRLVDNPDTLPLQASEADPSVYWLPVEGDTLFYFEVLDEQHAIRMLRIDQ